MRLSRRYLFLVALLGVTVAILPAVASSAGPSIEAVNVGLYSHYWSPAQVSVAAGGAVTLSNSTEVAHGIEWRSALKPTCEEGAGKIPVGTTATASGTKWSGTCTFTEAGTYTFYCTVHGPEMTGTVTVTIPGAPTATTGAASAVSEAGATLEGTVNPQGKATTYHFNYGTTASYGLETPEEAAGAGSTDKPVFAPVTGLTSGTTYHYQLVAKNGSGATPGVDRTFTTESAPGAPIATTGAATALSETGETLKGTVNPDGEPTKYFFEWGTTSSYGQVTSELPAGEDHNGHAESATLTGLAAGTVYHFRLVAKNASGPSSGADGQFTTVSPLSSSSPGTTITTPPLPPSVQPPPSKPEPALPSGSALAAGSLKLTAPRHHASLLGSIEVGQAGAGGRLEVDLLAKGSALAQTRGSGSKAVRVGHVVRQSLSAGKLSFTVVLTAQGRRALTRHRSLPVTVRITLTPTQGKPVTLTRSVTLHS
jgi:plastocyanin